MAIIVEEERSGVNIVRLLGWLTVIAVVGVAAYYLFFVSPESVTISPPAGFQSVTLVSQFTSRPEDLINGSAFQALKPPSFPLPTPQSPAAVGRLNPFVAP